MGVSFLIGAVGEGPGAMVAVLGRTRPPAARLGATPRPEEEWLTRLPVTRVGSLAAPPGPD